MVAVSYTHLDVYKRQVHNSPVRTKALTMMWKRKWESTIYRQHQYELLSYFEQQDETSPVELLGRKLDNLEQLETPHIKTVTNLLEGFYYYKQKEFIEMLSYKVDKACIYLSNDGCLLYTSFTVQIES